MVPWSCCPKRAESTQPRKVVSHCKESASRLTSCEDSVHLLQRLLTKTVSLCDKQRQHHMNYQSTCTMLNGTSRAQLDVSMCDGFSLQTPHPYGPLHPHSHSTSPGRGARSCVGRALQRSFCAPLAWGGAPLRCTVGPLGYKR